MEDLYSNNAIIFVGVVFNFVFSGRIFVSYCMGNEKSICVSLCDFAGSDNSQRDKCSFGKCKEGY